MAQTQKLYTRTWKNTGMEGTPIYVFQLADSNGTLGDAVGDIIMLSEDTSRKYIIHSYGVEIAGTDMVAYFEDAGTYAEDGFTPKDMMTIFVESCEEVFHKGYTDVYHDEIANAMHEVMGFKCEKGYDYDTYEDYVRVYREDFAQMMHIGEDCSFCFSEESVSELMEVYPNATCSMELETVIMMYPDGSYDEDMAYVVYHNANEENCHCYKTVKLMVEGEVCICNIVSDEEFLEDVNRCKVLKISDDHEYWVVEDNEYDAFWCLKK